ncbi:MAG TPA: ATP-binding cassette domain-containing protein [Thermoanaerobaculia bacterium]|jgi:ABC-2 type transport system ATP-binding protein|nr:ATP-binding cassette domain-containing protein [Thermoanaerobaculia bacterium]
MADAILCEELTKRYAGMAPRGGAPAPVSSAPPGNGNPQEGGVLAVDRLSLEIRAGELFGLLGPNGAGKSTTIGMLTTRVIPTSGKALVAGIDVVAQPALARTRLAAVTQTNTLDRGLTVFDNLYFHGRYFGLPRAECRQRAGELLAHFGLEEKAKARVDQLSGGLAQRVLIARALLHRPEVLFLDEPTSGLDPQSRLRLWEELTAINRAGQTIVLTTHYMEEAEQLCERLAIVDHGRLLALDTPQGLKNAVHAERLLKLTLADCESGHMVEAIEKVPGVVQATCDADGKTGHIVHVQADGTPGLVGAVVAAVAQAGGELRDLSVSETSLEAVFLKLTGKEYRA